MAPSQFGYTGQRVDAESGTYYFRARHYSPVLGRFLQADPIGHQGGMHLYAYVANDPLNATDREGLILENAANGVGQYAGDSYDVAAQLRRVVHQKIECADDIVCCERLVAVSPRS